MTRVVETAPLDRAKGAGDDAWGATAIGAARPGGRNEPPDCCVTVTTAVVQPGTGQ